MTEQDFIQKFTRLTANRQGLSIIDQPDGACVFLAVGECTIQPVKPWQCSGFPNRWNFPGWQKVCEAIPVDAPGEYEKEASTQES